MEIFKAEEIFELGSRVTSALVTTKARPSGSGDVYMRYAAVAPWADGLAVGVANYPDIDKARAAAGRLAEWRE